MSNTRQENEYYDWMDLEILVRCRVGYRKGSDESRLDVVKAATEFFGRANELTSGATSYGVYEVVGNTAHVIAYNEVPDAKARPE